MLQIVQEHKLCLTLYIKIHMPCSLLLYNVGSLAFSNDNLQSNTSPLAATPAINSHPMPSVSVLDSRWQFFEPRRFITWTFTLTVLYSDTLILFFSVHRLKALYDIRPKAEEIELITKYQQENPNSKLFFSDTFWQCFPFWRKSNFLTWIDNCL